MDRRFQVKQYVAVVRGASGGRFRVLRTGDDRYYLFDAIDERGCSTGLQFPVLKSRLRTDVKRALAHGWGTG